MAWTESKRECRRCSQLANLGSDSEPQFLKIVELGDFGTDVSTGQHGSLPQKRTIAQSLREIALRQRHPRPEQFCGKHPFAETKRVLF